MAISQEKSFGIYWTAVEGALAITIPEPKNFSEIKNKTYSSLFDGWPADKLDDGDSKVAASLKKAYTDAGYKVNATDAGLAAMSKASRTSTDTVNDFFLDVNEKILEKGGKI